ncbi:hypothetical protein ABZ770_41250 [Streptomyces sp. NPDC006654]|uniref:hypothetical protein n=1 Tax=Streptomyces sp. NPDC006654 TaxID=3156897 RepID=UPI0033CF9575
MTEASAADPSADIVNWSDTVQDVLTGDLVTALAYGTPAGGAVAIPVSPLGLADRDAGTIGVTTSLAFNGKLRNILRDPRVAMAYHTRDHGFADTDGFVLAQGEAVVPLEPSPEVLAALEPKVTRFLGAMPAGRLWDWVLGDYLDTRVVIDILLKRIASWPDVRAAGDLSVAGAAWPEPPMPQLPPAKGSGPRLDTGKLHRQVDKLQHQLLAYRGADGHPVVLPVRVTGYDERGLFVEAATGLLPPGGRRAGLTAHSFGPQAVGLANRICTGWLETSGNTAVYAPHTAAGFAAPPMKSVQLFFNGLFAKRNWRKAVREGTLAELAAIRANAARVQAE